MIPTTVLNRHARSQERAREKASKLARGSYQHGIVSGACRLSGADLAGKASRYSSRYAASRQNLLERIDAAGIPCCELRVGPGSRRELVWGRVAVEAQAAAAVASGMQAFELAMHQAWKLIRGAA